MLHPLGSRPLLGFARRCSRPPVPLEASIAYSAISFSRVLLSRLCHLSSTVGAFQCSIARLRLNRHAAKVRSEPLDLLRLPRQVRPSCGQGVHQPKLPQPAAENAPPSCFPAPLPVWRCASAPTTSELSRISCSVLRMSCAHRPFMLASCFGSPHRGSRAQAVMGGGKAFGAACTLATVAAVVATSSATAARSLLSWLKQAVGSAAIRKFLFLSWATIKQSHLHKESRESEWNKPPPL